MELNNGAGASPEEASPRGKKRSASGEDSPRKDSRLWCDTCDVGCNSLAVMEAHLEGRRHKNKEMEKKGDSSSYRCDLCDIGFSSPLVVQEHLNGRRHKAKESKGKILSCRLCNVRVTGEVAMRNHCRGRKHMSREKAKGDDPVGEKGKETKVDGNLDDLDGEKGKEAQAEEEEEKKEYWCLACKVKYDSLQEMVQHRNSLHDRR